MPPPEFSELASAQTAILLLPTWSASGQKDKGSDSNRSPSEPCMHNRRNHHNMSVQLPSEGNVSEKSGGLGESSDPELFKNILGCLQETA